MGLTKWNSELTNKFISLYRDQEILWKTDNLIYRDPIARNDALKNIIIGMGLPGLTIDDVKKKIKHLRSTYMVEVNKIEKSRQSDEGKVYKPQLSWFHEMDSFIKHFTSKRKVCNSSITQLDSQNSEDERTAELKQPIHTSPTDIKKQQNDNQETSTDEQPGPSQSRLAVRSIETEIEYPTQPKRLRVDQQSALETNKTVRTENNLNEYEVFGKYVGIQLQSLPEEDAIVAQEEIQSILTYYRSKKIRSIRASSYSMTYERRSNHSQQSQPLTSDHRFQPSPSHSKVELL